MQKEKISVFQMKGTVYSLFLLVMITLFFEYYVPAFFSVVFYLMLLYWYSQSKNEPFWLAFFLVVSDGFMGFLGAYTLTFDILPGLPAVELSQVYVLFTIFKARGRPNKTPLFFSGFLKVFSVWILFLVVQGYLLGLSTSLNIQLRLIKVTLPFALFYSIPKLFNREEDFQQFFKYLFPIAISALVAQVFTISQGISLPEYFGVSTPEFLVVGPKSHLTYRVLYSQKVLLITLFAALFYLAKRNSVFNNSYLFLIVMCTYFSVFLSATRGWFICFSFVVGMSFLFAIRTNLKSIIIFLVFAVGLTFLLNTIPSVKSQITNASERLSTIKSLASGDLENAKSLRRIEVRSPRVLKKWRDSKLTGWGYSDTYFEYSDIHVANQNMLLHGGIIELALFWTFIAYFIMTLLNLRLRIDKESHLRGPILVPIFFLMGWLFIHSTSGQHFNFIIHPSSAIPQVVFFCFCAELYKHVNEFTISSKSFNIQTIKFKS